jgi:hypothetical protein
MAATRSRKEHMVNLTQGPTHMDDEKDAGLMRSGHVPPDAERHTHSPDRSMTIGDHSCTTFRGMRGLSHWSPSLEIHP